MMRLCKNVLGILGVLASAYAIPQSTMDMPNNTVWANVSGIQGAGAPVPVALIPSGTPGGLLFFYNSSTVLGSTGTLESGALVVGGGSSGTPTVLGGAGSDTGLVTVTGDVAGFVPVVTLALGGCGVAVNANGSNSNAVCGYRAGFTLTGTNDSAFGEYALGNETTGVGNSAFGEGAGDYISTGQGNTAVGASALQGTGASGGADEITGQYNTALGFNSMVACQTIGTAICGANTAVGASAGSAITTGASNTIIGENVGSTVLTTGSYNFLAGHSAAVTTPAATTNNYVNIENGLVGYNSLAGVSVSSGGGTSPGAPTGSTTFLFFFTEGTGTPSATLVLGLPAVPTGWDCDAADRAAGSVIGGHSTGALSTTSATITLSAAPAAGDLMRVKCLGS